MSVTAFTMAAAQKAAWIALDIETSDAPEAAIQAVIDDWKAPLNWKAETVELKRKEAAARIRDRAALLDASPILCCALMTDQGARFIFHSIDGMKYPVEGWTIIPGMDERGLLVILRMLLDNHADRATTIVTHNGRSFDLPKLRRAYIQHSMYLPDMLRPRLDDEPPARIADTMGMIKAFSMENRDERFISLDTVATTLGIQRPKQSMKGSDVPRLYREGQHQAILTYCAIDCATTARAYSLMTGQADDLT